MIVYTDGTVYLEAGEVVPVRCDGCFHIYQPPVGSIVSHCPKCWCRMEHGKQEFVPIERTKMDD